jgi:SPX domain protein involved in polyphosphate accumulation
MSKILSFKDIRQGLKGRHLYRVQEESFVSYKALQRLLNKNQQNFRLITLKRISKYIIDNSIWKPDEGDLIDIDYIISELSSELKKRNLAEISRLCFVSYPTLIRMHNKIDESFRFRTLKHMAVFLFNNPLEGEEPNKNLIDMFKGQLENEGDNDN